MSQLRQNPKNALAHSLACEIESDLDLAYVIDFWSTLPDALRARILAIARASNDGKDEETRRN